MREGLLRPIPHPMQPPAHSLKLAKIFSLQIELVVAQANRIHKLKIDMLKKNDRKAMAFRRSLWFVARERD